MTTKTGTGSKFGVAKQSDYETEANAEASIARFIPNKSALAFSPELVDDEGLTGDVFMQPADQGAITTSGVVGPVDCRYEDNWFELLLAQIMGDLAVPSLQTDGYEQVYTRGDNIWWTTIAHENPGLVGTTCVNGVHVFTGCTPTEITITGEGANPLRVEATISGEKRLLASATNTSLGDLDSSLKPKLLQKDAVIRMNLNSGDALDSDDEVCFTSWSLTFTRGLKADIFCTGSQFAKQQEPDGFWDVKFEGKLHKIDNDDWDNRFNDNDHLKMDIIVTGPSIGTDDYFMKVEIPRAELMTYSAEVEGAAVVQPDVELRVTTSNSPTGMVFTSPVKITLQNTRDTKITA